MRKPIPTVGPAAPGSLAAALGAVPDPRHPYGWWPERPPLPLVGLLQFTVAAVVCGARSLYAMAQWGRERVEDDPALLTDLGLPPGRSPSVATLHRLFKALDVAAFERAVGEWLARTGVEPGDALALDGKALRGVHGAGVPGAHLVGAHAQRAGALLAQVRSEGKGREVAAAGQLLEQAPLSGRLVTGDALLTQRPVSRRIVARGGDYLLPVEANQPTLRDGIAVAFSPLDREQPGRGHAAARAALAGARPGRARGALEHRDAAGAEGAARAARGAAALGAVRPGAQRVSGLAASGPSLPGRASAEPGAAGAGDHDGTRGHLPDHQRAAGAGRGERLAPDQSGPLGDREPEPLRAGRDLR